MSIKSCFIDFTGTLHRTDKEFIVKFNDSIVIDNDVITVGGIKTTTPLEEKVYIGLGLNIKDKAINNRDVFYNFICINGTIVKNEEVEGDYNGSIGSNYYNNNSLDLDFIINNEYERIYKFGI